VLLVACASGPGPESGRDLVEDFTDPSVIVPGGSRSRLTGDDGNMTGCGNTGSREQQWYPPGRVRVGGEADPTAE